MYEISALCFGLGRGFGYSPDGGFPQSGCVVMRGAQTVRGGHFACSCLSSAASACRWASDERISHACARWTSGGAGCVGVIFVILKTEVP